MTDESYPLRAIVRRRYYHPENARTGTGSVELVLECGHRVHRKQSQEPRRLVRCEQCYFDQSGGM